MLPLNYIFRILELGETLEVFFITFGRRKDFRTHILKLSEHVSLCQMHLFLDLANYFL